MLTVRVALTDPDTTSGHFFKHKLFLVFGTEGKRLLLFSEPSRMNLEPSAHVRGSDLSCDHVKEVGMVLFPEIQVSPRSEQLIFFFLISRFLLEHWSREDPGSEECSDGGPPWGIYKETLIGLPRAEREGEPGRLIFIKAPLTACNGFLMKEGDKNNHQLNSTVTSPISSRTPRVPPLLVVLSENKNLFNPVKSDTSKNRKKIYFLGTVMFTNPFSKIKKVAVAFYDIFESYLKHSKLESKKS